MLTRLFRPTIRNAPELRRYVILVTSCCVALTLGIDIILQLVFFVDWSSAWRDWIITFAEAAGLSAPISFGIGSTNLELFKAKQAAELASRTDPMTGLMNRRALTDRVQSLDGATLALVIADIDHFKRVNDLYGHLAGDRVIEAVGRMMADDLAEFGPLARVGGEEFALLSCNVPAEAIVARLNSTRNRIAETPVIADSRAVRVTISAGVATGGPHHGFEKLYAQADRALYLAKMSGRNRVLTFEDISALDVSHGFESDRASA